MSETFGERLRRLQIGDGYLTLAGVRHNFIIVREIDPRLPYCTGSYLDTFFVSVRVPEAFRYAVVAHEVICALKPYYFGRSIDAIEQELTFVSPEDLKAYRAFRIEYYDQLIRYYDRRGDETSFHRELRRARARVEAIS